MWYNWASEESPTNPCLIEILIYIDIGPEECVSGATYGGVTHGQDMGAEIGMR